MIIEEIEKSLKKHFEKIDAIALANTKKVLDAFIKNKISEPHFKGSTGYGYGDMGREKLCSVYATVFNTKDAVVSPRISCGTHAISLMLFGLLRPGDTVLCISGKPYDTLNKVIYGKDNGSLQDYNIKFETIDLTSDNEFDFANIEQGIKKHKPKMVYVQRSKGYSARESFSIAELKNAFDHVKKHTDAIIAVDNCYGEFLETKEPTDVGAHVLAGSLKKNPGGTIAPTGGYVVGDEVSIKKINNKLDSPASGGEVGSFEMGYRLFFQGFFTAPSIVKDCQKGTLLLSEVLKQKGFKATPNINCERSDIVCTVELKSAKNMERLANLVQQNSPVDSFVSVIPGDMPGYDSQIIMAAGAFVQGSTSELSADGSVREPYRMYIQGGICYEHIKLLAISMLEKF